MSSNLAKPLTFRFIDGEADVRLELSNDADQPLKCVEILTVFLKDLETPGGGPSQAHIRFEAVGSIRPKENVVLSHKTWVNGKIAGAGDLAIDPCLMRKNHIFFGPNRTNCFESNVGL